MDGVFIGGCWPGECHYLTEGNYLAYSTVNIAKKLMQYIGINPDRLRLEWMSAAEGTRFAELINAFSNTLKSIGPLDGDANRHETKLEIANRLIPYIKLVERERLRVPVKSIKAYEEFYQGKEFKKLYRELIEEKLHLMEITTLLRGKPRSSGEIAEATGMSQSEVLSYMNSSSKYGLINYNPGDKFYSLSTQI